MTEVAAVGDSWGDLPMLRAAGQGAFLGRELPESLPHVRHMPDASIDAVVAELRGRY